MLQVKPRTAQGAQDAAQGLGNVKVLAPGVGLEDDHGRRESQGPPKGKSGGRPLDKTDGQRRGERAERKGGTENRREEGSKEVAPTRTEVDKDMAGGRWRFDGRSPRTRKTRTGRAGRVTTA